MLRKVFIKHQNDIAFIKRSITENIAWPVTASLNLRVRVTLKVKNNARNGFLIPKLVKNDYLFANIALQ